MGIAIEVQVAEFERLTLKLRAFALAVNRVHDGQSSTPYHPGDQRFVDLTVLADKVRFSHRQDQRTGTLGRTDRCTLPSRS